MMLKRAKILDLRRICDPRGDLSFVEGSKDIPFEIKRIYYIFNVPEQAERGAHGHKNLQQLMIPLSGSFNIRLFDGVETLNFRLDDPCKALYIPKGMWRDLYNFSANSICLVLASDYYDENDYFRELSEFMRFNGGNE